MKKYILMTLMAGLGLSVIAGGAPKKASVTTMKVDAKESTFKWHATKVTGEHSGTVNYSQGTVMLSAGKLVGGEVTMDMTSIEVTDLKGEYHDKLVGHLKGDDFFGVASHATSTMKVVSATPIKDAAVGSNNYTIVADLTIKGITKQITFPAMVVITNKQVIINADFDIDRTEYDIRYGSGKFFEGIGDKAIMDKFNVKVRVVAH